MKIRMVVIFFLILTFIACDKTVALDDTAQSSSSKKSSSSSRSSSSSKVSTSSSSVMAVTDIGTGWDLVWHDDFTGTTLDAAKWNVRTGRGKDYNGWGNAEVQSFESANVQVRDGKLFITAKKESSRENDGWWCKPHCNYTSGRIDSKDKYAVRFGKIEAMIKMPVGDALWPAFWMLHESGTWPDDGEIDIAEMKGREPNKVISTVHWKGDNGQPVNYAKTLTHTESLDQGFNLYSVEWSETTIVTRFNNRTVNTFAINDVVRYPFGTGSQIAYYLILNFALGGDFDTETANGKTFGGWPNYVGWPLDSFTSAEMVVDWVRVLKKK